MAHQSVEKARQKWSKRAFESSIVWIFGSPRSGSTWLLDMLCRITGGVGVNEPQIGAHLGLPASAVIGLPVPGEPLVLDALADEGSYFFSRRAMSAWTPGLRNLVIGRFRFQARRHEQLTGRYPRFVIVKEPWGSSAAPVLLRALPCSRVLFLVRDGRDVVHSLLDGASEGWITTSFGVRVGDDATRGDFVAESARRWVQSMDAVRRGFRKHPKDRRLLVRYELLRKDPAGQLRRIVRWLGRRDLLRSIDDAVRATEFSAIASSDRGARAFHRSASPGIWREQMTSDDQAVMESVMRPTLDRFGYT